MSYISECPVTERAWNQRSADKNCSPQNNYHCVRTQDNGVLELCTHPFWMQAGKCPYYNKAGRMDSSDCQRREMFRCPTTVYKSNEVFNYPSCFPEKREVTTYLDNPLPTPFVGHNITLPVIYVSNEGGGNSSALAALILLLLPVVLVFLIFWKRTQIIPWINNMDKTGQTLNDIEQGKTEEDTLLPKGSPNILHQTELKNVLPSENPATAECNTKKQSEFEGTVSPSGKEKVRDPDITRRRLNTSLEPDLSMVEKMSEVLSKKDVLVLIGSQGSGKSTLAQKITEAACRMYPEGANMRFIKDLKELNETMTDKETFLNLDEFIKAWFNEKYLNVVYKTISNVLHNKSNKVHILLCASPEIWNKSSKLFLSSNFQYEVLDLTNATSYTDDDWDTILHWHMRRNIERKKYITQDKSHVTKLTEEFRKHEAREISKPGIAYLLCKSEKTLKNPQIVLEDPRKFLESEINGLLKRPWFGHNSQNSFVVLVYLMLHNGKALSSQMKPNILEDICSAYEIQVKLSPNEVKYDEIEVKKDEMSIRSKIVLRVTFDYVWKDHKDLIIKYCDDDLFLELITLTGCAEQEIVEIAKRFESMIHAGKQNVEHHYLLDDLPLKVLLQN